MDININGGLCQNGLVLTGKDLEQYTKRKGLCRKCARVATHKRAGKLWNRSKFYPLTVKRENGEGYLVYKGYCIQPTCYTLDEAMELLGEETSMRNLGSARPLRASMIQQGSSAGLEVLTHRETKSKTRRDSSATPDSSSTDNDESWPETDEKLLVGHRSPSYQWSNNLPLIHVHSMDTTNASTNGSGSRKPTATDDELEDLIKTLEKTTQPSGKNSSKGKSSYKKGLKRVIFSSSEGNNNDRRETPEHTDSSAPPASYTSGSSSAASVSSDESSTCPKPQRLPGSGFLSSTSKRRNHRAALERAQSTNHFQLKTLCLQSKLSDSPDIEMVVLEGEASNHSWLMEEFLLDGENKMARDSACLHSEKMAEGHGKPVMSSKAAVKTPRYKFSLTDTFMAKPPFTNNRKMFRVQSSGLSDCSSSLDTTASAKSTCATDVRMTVFQSAPLAYVDPKTGIHHECPLLDFDYEARALTQALTDAADGANVDVQFDIATTDRLSAFLAKSESRVMHLSCHGHPDYLALENGFGGMQVLRVRDLKRFIGAGTGNLEVVFVSACHSKAAGKAFLDAGIKHVICCRQDDKFRDEGAIEFSRGFYRALALNNTLKQAFKMAREAVRVSPLVLNSKVEYEKFLLLPELPDNDPYHDVHIFTKSYKPLLPGVVDDVAAKPTPRILPRVPQFFVGREKDMYMVIEALRSNEVIQIQGERGIGKTSLAAAAVRYIEQRRKSFFFDDIFWIPAQKGAIHADDSLYLDLSRIMYLILRARERPCQMEKKYADIWGQVVRDLQHRRILLVIHGSHLSSEASRKSLECFLSDLLKVANAKVIIVGAAAFKDDVVDSTIVNVEALDYDATVLAFARLVRSPSTSGQQIISSLTIFPTQNKQGLSVEKLVSWRRRKIFEMIGKGVPAAIRRAALDMSEEELTALLGLAQRPLVGVNSRHELDSKIVFLKGDEAQHLRRRDFLRARDIQKTIEELQCLRENFPTMEELVKKKKRLKGTLQAAIESKRYESANQIQQSIGEVQAQIDNELQQEQEAKQELMRILRLASF